MLGLVPQLEDPSPLGGKVHAGVQRAQRLVGDLGGGHRFTMLSFSHTFIFVPVFVLSLYFSEDVI